MDNSKTLADYSTRVLLQNLKNDIIYLNYATFFIIPVYIIASNKNSAIFYERRLRRVINEIKLLHNLKSKKRNSLEDVIKLYTPYVSVVIYNTIGSIAPKEDVDEVISDTFLQLWRNADSIDEEKGCIRSYVGAVARNIRRQKMATRAIFETRDRQLIPLDDIQHINARPNEAVKEGMKMTIPASEYLPLKSAWETRKNGYNK